MWSLLSEPVLAIASDSIGGTVGLSIVALYWRWSGSKSDVYVPVPVAWDACTTRSGMERVELAAAGAHT